VCASSSVSSSRSRRLKGSRRRRCPRAGTTGRRRPCTGPACSKRGATADDFAQVAADDDAGVLVDAQAHQLGVAGYAHEEALQAAALGEVRVDDGAEPQQPEAVAGAGAAMMPPLRWRDPSSQPVAWSPVPPGDHTPGSHRLAAETWAILHPKRDAHSTTAKLCLRPRLRRTT
jgi:hypothetical protein